MRLGIDFGTTRTRVAAVVKGNYPLITFQGEAGDGADWYPSLVAVQGDRLAFGLQAQAVQYEPGWEVLGSFKRLLCDTPPDAAWKVGQVELPAIQWMTRFLAALRQDLLVRSNLDVGRRERFEAMVGIPATANSNQRFLTLEAFRQAGYDVMGTLNEPVAAGIEYAHRYRAADLTRRREHVVVYDLGGGTFDVAVICMAGNQHEVIASEGISRLRGDDLDAVLLDMALSDPAVALVEGAVPRPRLLHLCREAKESIHPNSRKIPVDFEQIEPELGEVMVPVAEFYEKCSPLILRTIDGTETAMQAGSGSADGDNPALASLYLVGGSCELAVLARSLRDRFGKRVRRSPYPSAATAIGLAIAADQALGYVLKERFSRHFGVWREGEAGHRVVFDPIFTKETPLPQPGQPPLLACRRYYVETTGRLARYALWVTEPLRHPARILPETRAKAWPPRRDRQRPDPPLPGVWSARKSRAESPGDSHVSYKVAATLCPGPPRECAGSAGPEIPLADRALFSYFNHGGKRSGTDALADSSAAPDPWTNGEPRQSPWAEYARRGSRCESRAGHSARGFRRGSI